MLTKICSVCEKEQNISEFHKSKRSKDGLDCHCKTCESARKKIARANHPEVFRARWKKYKDDNREKVLLRNKKYKKDNSENALRQRRERRSENLDKVRHQSRELYLKNKEKRLEEARDYRKSNKGLLEEKRRKQREADPKKYRAQTAVTNAVGRGKLPKVGTLKCNVCKEKALHYHHFLGYEEEHKLDVVPLCAKCHKGIHAGLITLEMG